MTTIQTRIAHIIEPDGSDAYAMCDIDLDTQPGLQIGLYNLDDSYVKQLRLTIEGTQVVLHIIDPKTSQSQQRIVLYELGR